MGNKRNEITTDDRKKITHLYADMAENEYCKIFHSTEFIYREYAVYQPLQRNYAITEERIEQMLAKGSLSSMYDEAKVLDFENQGVALSDKDRARLEKFYAAKPLYDSIIAALRSNVSEEVSLSPAPFVKRLAAVLPGVEKKWLEKIADGLSVMDKEAEIQRDRKGDIIWDKETKDAEIVR